MKKKFIGKLPFILLSLLIIVSSCSKEHSNNPPLQPATDTLRPLPVDHPLVIRYEYAPNLYTLFKYNSYGQVTGITDINDIARTDRIVSYKVDGKVDKIIIDKYGFLKFIYNNTNQLVQVDSYVNNNPVLQGYYKFIYDGQKVIETLFYSNYYTSTLHPQAKTDIQYDAIGDKVRSDIYLWDLDSGTYYKAAYFLFKNDAHPNPVYGMRDIFMVLYDNVVGPHNLTKAESFHADGTVDQNNTYDFLYDDKGYPVSAGRRNLAAGPDIFVTLKFKYR